MTRAVNSVVYLTAGAGGMFCGSCLNDNTLARGLTELGIDVQLVPTYTPIRTDENDVSIDQVFFGGINVFLQQKFPPLRLLPAVFDRFLNHPKLIAWATKKDVQADPNLLGGMTISMLKGTAGFQRKEVNRLLRFLRSCSPDIVNFTNVLIAGSAPEMRRRLGVPIVVTLQGDDVFLDFLPKRYRQEAIARIRDLADSIDAFIVHSTYYADYMSERLGISRGKMHLVKLGIDATDLVASPSHPGQPKRIGYLARLTPEKGLHVLVDAFIELRKYRNDVELHIAGWLGTEHQEYAQQQFTKLQRAGLEDSFEYHGVVDRFEKLSFLKNLDLFTVPTTYREPKGRFALEAMACGLPMVLPDHGAFPELVAETQAGILVRPEDPRQLADVVSQLLDDPVRCAELGRRGRAAIQLERNSRAMAQRTLEIYELVVSASSND